jgi:hypothetical protein
VSGSRSQTPSRQGTAGGNGPLGPLLRPLYREIHDPASPASTHRLRILGELTALFKSRVESLGRPRLDEVMYDTLLHVIEHVGHQAFWPQQESASGIIARRRVIERIVMASLTLPEENRLVPPLDYVLESVRD